MLLMAGSEVLHENLTRAHIVEDELKAKLRLAEIRSTSKVACVILESTGAVSVLRRGELIGPALLAAVRDPGRTPENLLQPTGRMTGIRTAHLDPASRKFAPKGRAGSSGISRPVQSHPAPVGFDPRLFPSATLSYSSEAPRPSEDSSSSQALSHRRHASAQTLQCSCICACCPHSSAQALQTARQASRMALVMLAS